MKKEKYIVTGMTCSACSSRVEKAVSKLEGIGKAKRREDCSGCSGCRLRRRTGGNGPQR